MADVVKNTKVLSLGADFSDGDTRTLNVNNPTSDASLGAGIDSLSSFIKNNNLIIGDKNGAAFTGFSSAQVKTQKSTYLDLTTGT